MEKLDTLVAEHLNFRNGSVPFRKAYLQSLIDVAFSFIDRITCLAFSFD
jgi:hypothetical protein